METRSVGNKRLLVDDLQEKFQEQLKQSKEKTTSTLSNSSNSFQKKKKQKTTSTSSNSSNSFQPITDHTIKLRVQGLALVFLVQMWTTRGGDYNEVVRESWHDCTIVDSSKEKWWEYLDRVDKSKQIVALKALANDLLECIDQRFVEKYL